MSQKITSFYKIATLAHILYSLLMISNNWKKTNTKKAGIEAVTSQSFSSAASLKRSISCHIRVYSESTLVIAWISRNSSFLETDAISEI